jgi:threonine-phosphate decarboxylase
VVFLLQLLYNPYGRHMTWYDGNIHSVMAKRGSSQNVLIDFSASVNPLGTPKKVILEIKKGLRNLIHYPDMNTTKLREKLGNVYNIDPQSIICGLPLNRPETTKSS